MSKKKLLIDRRYWPTFWTMFFGAFNDNLFKNALVILITYKAASMSGRIIDLDAKSMVALCGGIFILPFFLFSATAGQISDKYSKSKLMFWIKIWEIAVMVLGAVGFMTNNLAVLLITLFFMGLQSTFFGPIKYSVLPEIIKTNELVKGNAFFGMGTFVSILLGTIAGGLVINMSENGALYVSLLVIFFAGLGTWFSSKILKLKAVSPSVKVNFGVIKPSIDILKITKKDPKVFLAVSGISWFWFLGAALLSMFPDYVKNSIGGDESIVTLFLALFSIGIATGSLICEKLSQKKLELGLVPLGTFGITLFMLDLFVIGNPPRHIAIIGFWEFFNSFTNIRIIFDLFMLSFFSGFFTVPLYTYVQQYSEEKNRSRVIAGLNIYNAFLMVFSAVFLILLYKINFSMGQIFGTLALGNLIVGLIIYKKMPEFMEGFKTKFLRQK